MASPIANSAASGPVLLVETSFWSSSTGGGKDYFKRNHVKRRKAKSNRKMHQANRWFCSLCALSSSCALTAGFVATPALMAAGRGSARKIGDHHRGRIFRAVDGESAEIDWDKEWKAKLAELKKNEEQEDGASQPEIPRDQQQFESIKEVLDKEEEEEEYSDRIPVAFSKRKEIIVDRDGDEYIYREVDFRGREEGSGFLLEGETVTSKAQQDGLFLGNLGGQNQLQNVSSMNARTDMTSELVAWSLKSR